MIEIVNEIKGINDLDKSLKEDTVVLSNEMLFLFVNKMNGKKNTEVLNAGINCMALLINTIVQSLSPDHDSQSKIIDGVAHFAHLYNDTTKLNPKQE